MPQGVLMTVREAAAALRLTPIAALDLADEGHLESEQIEGQTFIRRSSFDRYAARISGATQ